MNSSVETTCVGMGESTPLFRSRCHFGIHMGGFFLCVEVCSWCENYLSLRASATNSPLPRAERVVTSRYCRTDRNFLLTLRGSRGNCFCVGFISDQVSVSEATQQGFFW